MKKKLFTIALSAIMVVAMAVPTLAAVTRSYDFGETKDTYFVSHAYEGGSLSNKNLNVYGNNTITNGRNVCIWSGPLTSAQKWNYLSRDGSYRLFSSLAGGSSFALNVYRVADSNNTFNCNMYQTAGNLADTAVRWYVPTNDTGSVHLIAWKAAANATEYYLTAMSNNDNGDVRWVPKNNGFVSGASHAWGSIAN